jgi:Transposase
MTDSTAARRSGQHLSDINIGKILGLAKAKLPQRNIAALMKCSQKAIQHTLATYLFETFQGRNARREYARKTTKLQDRYIERVLKKNDLISLRDITNLVGLPISHWTVAHRRSEKGMGSFIAAQKPGLWVENVAKRLEWANQYKDWTIDDWKHVIWSDESSIWIGVNLQ